MIVRVLQGPVLIAVLSVTAHADDVREIRGYVTTLDGSPIKDARVVASDGGLTGWTTSESDGSFKLKSGTFLSFSHANYKPILVHAADLKDPVRVQMAPADETQWKPARCDDLPRKGRGWIGGQLRVKPKGRYKGPTYGQHDVHWLITRGKDQLHVVDGLMQHSGLPGEVTMVRFEPIAVHGWVFDKIAGLDLAGAANDGKYWRWVGGPDQIAVEYEGVNKESKVYFDRIIESMCIEPFNY